MNSQSYSRKVCLLSCSFWTPSSDPRYGTCFTFNSASGGKDFKSVTATGASAGGLDVELYLDQRMYLPDSMTPEAGIRLAIHHPTDLAQVDELGLNLAPNSLTSVALERVN